MSDAPEWEDIIREAIRAGLGGVHVSLPAVVVAYNPALQQATVKPIVHERFKDVRTGLEIPNPAPPLPIPNLPVVWPSGMGGTVGLTHGLAPGDPVTLLVGDRSTDEWRATGAPDVLPLDGRRFDLSDAVVIPGGRAFVPGPTGPLPPTAYDAAGAPVLSGTPATPVKLGSSLAVDGALKGTLFEANLATFLAGLTTFLTACSTATSAPQVAAAAVTFLPVAQGFAAQVSSTIHQSTTVKVSS